MGRAGGTVIVAVAGVDDPPESLAWYVIVSVPANPACEVYVAVPLVLTADSVPLLGPDRIA